MRRRPTDGTLTARDFLESLTGEVAKDIASPPVLPD